MKIYLAAPYSCEHEWLREWRVDQVNRKAAELMDAGHIVFSPISHSHPISYHTKADACDSDYWVRQDLAFMPACDEVWVLRLEGWQESKGIKRETAYAEELGKQVRFI